jgi:hypothetical protein
VMRPTSTATNTNSSRPVIAPASSFRPQPKPVQRPEGNNHYNRSEPTYHNLMSSRPAETYLDERS